MSSINTYHFALPSYAQVDSNLCKSPPDIFKQIIFKIDIKSKIVVKPLLNLSRTCKWAYIECAKEEIWQIVSIQINQKLSPCSKEGYKNYYENYTATADIGHGFAL